MNALTIQFDSLTSNIIIGILTGILTTALLYVISRVFIGLVLPWYRSSLNTSFLANGNH